MTLLHVVCGLGPPPIKNPGYAYVRCSLVGLLIIATGIIRNFQRFSDRRFVRTFELIFNLKLD